MFDPVFDAVHARTHRDILKRRLFHASPGALPSIASKCLPPPIPDVCFVRPRVSGVVGTRDCRHYRTRQRPQVGRSSRGVRQDRCGAIATLPVRSRETSVTLLGRTRVDEVLSIGACDVRGEYTPTATTTITTTTTEASEVDS